MKMRISEIVTDEKNKIVKVTVAIPIKEASKEINLNSHVIFVNDRDFQDMMVKRDDTRVYLKVPPKMLKKFPKISSRNAKWATDGKFIVIKV